MRFKMKMEKFGGGKRTRVVRVFRTDAEWAEGKEPDQQNTPPKKERN